MESLLYHRIEARTAMALPYVVAPVPAGFPSPADDYIDTAIDLNEHLIQHPSATFFVRAQGHSMTGAGIHDGDTLIVDRALTARDGDIIVALVNGEFTVKRLRARQGGVSLIAEHPNFRPIEIGEGADFEVWGVVTWVLHSASARR
jgi:DNA polymerase V